MIEFAKSYKASDGKCYGTLREAQIIELTALIQQYPNGETSKEMAERLLADKEAIIDILTTTDSSRPRARRINGGSKKRKSTSTVAPIQPQAA